MTARPRSLVVIGGGIAGLAAAWFAADAGLDVTVLEAGAGRSAASCAPPRSRASPSTSAPRRCSPPGPRRSS